MSSFEKMPGYDKEKQQKVRDIASDNKEVVIRYGQLDISTAFMDFDFVSLGVKWKDKTGKFFGTHSYVLTKDFLNNPTIMIEEFRKKAEDLRRKDDEDTHV